MMFAYWPLNGIIFIDASFFNIFMQKRVKNYENT